MIRKTYMYAAGEAGVEIIANWDDFAQYHIQDYGVAVDVAERILRSGESTNEDAHAGVWEIYDLAPIHGAADQLRRAVAAEIAEAERFGPR